MNLFHGKIIARSLTTQFRQMSGTAMTMRMMVVMIQGMQMMVMLNEEEKKTFYYKPC